MNRNIIICVVALLVAAGVYWMGRSTAPATETAAETELKATAEKWRMQAQYHRNAATILRIEAAQHLATADSLQTVLKTQKTVTHEKAMRIYDTPVAQLPSVLADQLDQLDTLVAARHR